MIAYLSSKVLLYFMRPLWPNFLSRSIQSILFIDHWSLHPKLAYLCKEDMLKVIWHRILLALLITNLILSFLCHIVHFFCNRRASYGIHKDFQSWLGSTSEIFLYFARFYQSFIRPFLLIKSHWWSLNTLAYKTVKFTVLFVTFSLLL